MKQKPASDLNWSKIKDFDESEFPPVLNLVDERLVKALQKFRTLLGRPLIPSPNKEGWARTDGSKKSQHYAVGRLSTAGDVFLSEDTDPRVAYLLACSVFTGVGIYYDTQLNGEPRVMLHVDLRPEPMHWCRVNGLYRYPSAGREDASSFFYLLNRGAPVTVG